MKRDVRKLECMVCVFNSHGNDAHWSQYDGESCLVLYRKSENDYDFLGMGSMWDIEFEDGLRIDAYDFELKLINE